MDPFPHSMQGSNFFWFEGPNSAKPLGFVALEGVEVEARAVVNRSGEKPYALHVQLPEGVPHAAEARPHLTIAAATQELQVGRDLASHRTPVVRLATNQRAARAERAVDGLPWHIACCAQP